MSGTNGSDDPRLAAARYRLNGTTDDADDTPARAGATREQLPRYAEVALEQAIRRGDFDDLPGSGKPLTDLHHRHDPDWWIRRKIEREQLTGLGPPALTLRTEDAGMDERLDAARTEQEVRGILDDFNRRVIEARRQLLGGPPVVTWTRDLAAELQRWSTRADERRQAEAEARERDAAARAVLSWWARRRARKNRL